MHYVTKYIRNRLSTNYDEKQIKRMQYFFKERFKGYGIRKVRIKTLVEEALFKHLEPLDFNGTLLIAQELFHGHMYEECQAAIILLEKHKKKFDKKALFRFAVWIDRYIENWAVCDSFCLKVVSYCFVNHPKLISELSKWIVSRNRWKRRAACVVLTKLCRKGEFTEEALTLAHRLICDKDEMVQKGVGWLLKEVSRTAPNKVIDFLNYHEYEIPSRVKAYAMERLNSRQRRKIGPVSRRIF